MENLSVFNYNVCSEQFGDFKNFSEHSFLCRLKQTDKENTHKKAKQLLIKVEELNSKYKLNKTNPKRDKYKETSKCTCKNCSRYSGHVNSKSRNHLCDFCEKIFHRTDKLRAHISTHTGLCLYKCNVCEKQFSRSDKMKRHILEKHTKERPYKCQKCFAEICKVGTFQDPQVLIIVILIHIT